MAFLCVRCQSAVLTIQEDVSESELIEHFGSMPLAPTLRDRLLLAAAAQHESADAPLCEVCMQSGISELSRAVEATRGEANLFKATRDDLGQVASNDAVEDLALFDEQLKQLHAREVRLKAKLAEIENEERELEAQEEETLKQFLAMQRQLLDNEDASVAVERQIAYCSTQLKKLKRLNILSDSFHIWHDGLFGTINGLRLGRLPDRIPVVSWQEISAALGQLCLLTDVIVKKCHIPLTNYKLLPRGSFSVIVKKDDRSSLELFTADGGLARFFSGRKFDSALVAYLAVISEVIAFFQRADRTIRVPYKIEGDKIGGLPVTLQFNSDDKWTQAMKFLLTDVKWIVTFVESKFRL